MSDYLNATLKRPERLSKETVVISKRAITGEFGKALADNYSAVLTDPGFFNKSHRHQYVECIKKIVSETPIRIIEGEWLVGSATFDMTRWHALPATHVYKPGEVLFYSLSHLTPGYERVMKIGYNGLRKEIEESLEKYKGDEEKTDFLNCLNICLDMADLWHSRYLEAINHRITSSLGSEKRRYETIYNNLKDVPGNPPKNFPEAIQSYWFTFSFLRACGNWPAVGRIDKILWPYLKKDLDEGTITLDEAREYIAHFWIKGCEWVTGETNAGNRKGSGDGQNYQNVVLAGLDDDGNDAENPITFLVLDVVEELGIADFPISVRISSKSSEKLIKRVAEVMRFGGDAVAVYNDDIVIPSLMDFGYSKKEACSYSNDGCWEVQVPGQTVFSYPAWDVLSLFQQKVLILSDDKPSDLHFNTFEELYKAYLDVLLDSFQNDIVLRGYNCSYNKELQTPLMALFVEDCIKVAKDYFHGGPRFKVHSPHASGLPDIANALQAIKYVVYDKKMMSLNEFMNIVKNNWKDSEKLRLFLRNKLTYYGNDDLIGDEMMQRVFNDYIDIIGTIHEKDGVTYPAGISTFGRQVTEEYLDNRTANPDGHKKGEFLSNNINPIPGTDYNGATALINSCAKLGLRRLVGGTALTVKLMPSVVQGEDGLNALVNMLYGFCKVGGHFMQLNVVDNTTLKDAQEHPEQYTNLTVRVSGWSARFNTLSKEWQDMIIQSTEKEL